ncbi:hypothetical protein [Pseudobacteriovorax antillogorgiicola]|uniref:Uncharacterized protein n=1 Tax=Pseudobacteriovorax antillogorgiicola TaxID=1513793 RepID=A0A1Y6CNR7_9BACT|nr:hypothetical protein [Pseudobacteriovorax antillogorgiicola]TCS44220.1 hypothetical protein EDD56_13420 [Pseudobacteriovorax antillogorgiicola]SMF80498.1 hypothetical protein SAMN06296036_13521 [Pseudobacteriovorax antillogorgiicola]
MAAVATTDTQAQTLYTNIDFMKAYALLSERTAISDAVLMNFFLKFLPRSENYRGKGYAIATSWHISNSKMASILNKSSPTTGSNYKDQWQAYGFILLNGLSYEESVYEHNGEVYKYGSFAAHNVQLSAGFLNFMEKIKAGEDISDDELEVFFSAPSYGKRIRRKRRLNVVNATNSMIRRRHEQDGSEIPSNVRYLSHEERKAKQFVRPDSYKKNLKETKKPGRRQRLAQDNWEVRFAEHLNVYGTEGALKRLKKSMKDAGWAREDYIIPVLNMIKKRGGSENDRSFAINFIYSKPLIEIFETVAEKRSEASGVLAGYLDTMTLANIPKPIISNAFSYWLEKMPFKRDEQTYISNFVSRKLEAEPSPKSDSMPSDLVKALDFSDLGVPDF